MEINYHKETDSLYIHLSSNTTTESEEIAPDTVAHFDEKGFLTALEIYSNASKVVDLDD